MAIEIIGGQLVRFPDDVTSEEIEFIKSEVDAGRPKPSLDKVRSMMSEVRGDMGAGEVAMTAAKNLPGSMYQLGEDTVSAIMDPLGTVDIITKLGAGALQNILPEGFVQAVGEDKESRDLANAVGRMYVEKYGSVEGFKNAFAQDPAGVISDAAMLLGIGGAAKVGPLSKAAEASGKAARVLEKVDPVAAAGATGSLALKAGTEAVGMTTGAGAEPIREAFRAGMDGGERGELFREGMRGDADMQNLLASAKENLAALRDRRNAQYQAARNSGTFKDPTVLDFTKIDDAFDKAFSEVTYEGKVKNPKAMTALNKAKALIDQWFEGDPQKFHTVEGFDALKQAIGQISDSLPVEARDARRVIDSLYNSVKGEIVKQAPDYAKVMKSYADSTDLIREIERSLSLNDKASADTALRKLTSVMRNNVNTNFGERSRLLDEIEGAPNLIKPTLAGQALEQFVPRGIQGATAGLGALGALNLGDMATAAGYATISSPRLVGEAVHGAGRVGGILREIGSRGASVLPQVPMSLADGVKIATTPQGRLLAAEAEQIKREQGSR